MRCPAPATKIKTMKSRSRVTVLVAVVASVSLIGIVLYALNKQSGTTKRDGRITIYSNDVLGRPVGGFCSYPLL